MPPIITGGVSPPGQSSGIGSVLSGVPLIGGVLNGVSQMFTNAMNRRFQMKMYNRERADALSDWNMQNAYNSPAQQMSRLKAAGLNPNLVYGNGANAQEAAPVRQSTPQGNNQSAPQFNFQGALPMLLFDLKSRMMEQQIDNLKTQNIVLGTQAGKNVAETGKINEITDAQIPAQIANLKSGTGLRDLELEIKKATEEPVIASSYESQAHLSIENSVMNFANERAQQLNLVTIAEKSANIMRVYADMKLIGARKDLVYAEAAAVEKSNTLKQTEIDARKNGYSWSDTQAERVAAQLLGKYGGSLPGVLGGALNYMKMIY